MIREMIGRWHDRWANWPVMVRVMVILVLLGGGGFLLLKPGYQWFRSWRVERNLAHAGEAYAAGRYEAARDLAMSVLRAGDNGVGALRVLAGASLKLNDQRRVDYARFLMFHPDANDADRLRGFEVVAKADALPIAGRGWGALPAECRKNPDFAVLFAERLIDGRRMREAAQVLAGVPKERRDTRVKMLQARVLVMPGERRSTDEGRRASGEGQRMIARAIVSGDREEVPGWLEVLEEVPVAELDGIEFGEARGVLEAMDGEAAASLALARLDFAQEPWRGEAVLRDAVERWRVDAPVALAEFLEDCGMSGMLLEVFADAEMDAHPELLPICLRARQGAGDWQGMRELIAEWGSLLPKVEALAYQAIADLRDDDPDTGAGEWMAAMEELAGSTEASGYLGLMRIARDAGLKEQAFEALLEAIRVGRGPLPLFEQVKPLLGWLSAQKRDNQLLEVCGVYLALEPGNPVLLTQYSYLSCVHERVEPERIRQALEPVAKAFPDKLPVQFVMAAVMLSDGKAEEALKRVTRFEGEFDKLSISYRMVLVAARVMAGELGRDDPQVTGFPESELMPTERRWFRGRIGAVER